MRKECGRDGERAEEHRPRFGGRGTPKNERQSADGDGAIDHRAAATELELAHREDVARVASAERVVSVAEPPRVPPLTQSIAYDVTDRDGIIPRARPALGSLFQLRGPDIWSAMSARMFPTAPVGT